MARAMNRKLDGAVKDFVKASGELAKVIDDLEASCTVIIDAVDNWRNKSRPGGLAQFWKTKRPAS